MPEIRNSDRQYDVGPSQRRSTGATPWRKVIPILIAAVVAVLVIAQVVAAQSGSSKAPKERASRPDPVSARCPKRALPIPGNAIAGATDAALRQAHALYRAVDTRAARAMLAELAPSPDPRVAEVSKQCGRRVASRTIVVALSFPAMKSASLSEGVVFVSKFSRGYRVWEVAH